MQKLDRSHDFGAISPPYQDETFDRPAYYEQGGRFYDAHDRLIEPGKPLPEDADGTHGAADRDTAEGLSPSDLVLQSDVIPWGAFRKRAKEILGATCPTGKTEMLIALREAIKHYEGRKQARRTKPAPAAEPPKSNGLTWNGITGQDGEPDLTAKPPQPVAPPAKSGEVDLAAWGRGQKEYIFGEVRKTIRAKYATSVTERRDAVDLPIAEKVITAAEARKDIT
mgnify:FL=1